MTSVENRKKEALGWLSIAFMMFLFPTLFFTVVWFPIWMGWTKAW